MMQSEALERAIKTLLTYCAESDWQGYDPYDGLKSRFFQTFPFKNNRVARLALIQFCKRSPFNFRNVLGIQKGHNPKGLGLFIASLLNLYSCFEEEKCKNSALNILELLQAQSIKGYNGDCWGYNFDWQSRTSFTPKNTPNVICTTFVANAFLDAYEVFKDTRYLQIARSSCEFILNDLNTIIEKDSFCFSYTPLDKIPVHNANFLAAALLAKVYSYTGDKNFLAFASRAVKFSTSYQNPDGSWYYGTLDKHKWIDGFHTGFNLVALNDYMNFSKNYHFNEVLERGFKYYKRNFFLKNGAPKYFHNSLYPIDIHSVAQGIITFVKLKLVDGGSVDQALKVAHWGIENMQDKKGFFYFQKHRLFSNKIPYIRWSQAWMAYALSLLLFEIEEGASSAKKKQAIGTT